MMEATGCMISPATGPPARLGDDADVECGGRMDDAGCELPEPVPKPAGDMVVPGTIGLSAVGDVVGLTSTDIGKIDSFVELDSEKGLSVLDVVGALT